MNKLASKSMQSGHSLPYPIAAVSTQSSSRCWSSSHDSIPPLGLRNETNTDRHTQIDRCTDIHSTYIHTYIQTDIPIYTHTHIHTDRQTDRHMLIPESWQESLVVPRVCGFREIRENGEPIKRTLQSLWETHISLPAVNSIELRRLCLSLTCEAAAHCHGK